MKQSKKFTLNTADLKRWLLTVGVVAVGAVVSHFLNELSQAPQTETTILVIAVLKLVQYYLQVQ